MIKFNKKIVSTKKSDILFCAVSMGEDSVALSHFLSQGFRRICLVYVNHGTSYADSAQAKFEQYIHWLNKQRKSKFPITGIVKKNNNYTEGMSEAELRDIRYNLIGDAIKENSNNGEVIICHHLNDCVESYLMNCLNGVPEYAPIPKVTVRDKTYRVIRPFLTTSKKSIINYINNNNLSEWVVQDPSNNDTEYSRRNWLRHSVIPEIQKKYTIETIVRKKIEKI